jgi:hypothetical protein
MRLGARATHASVSSVTVAHSLTSRCVRAGNAWRRSKPCRLAGLSNTHRATERRSNVRAFATSRVFHDVILSDIAASGQVHDPEVLELPRQRHTSRAEPFRRDDRVEHNLREVGGEGRDALVRPERRRRRRFADDAVGVRTRVRRVFRAVPGAGVEVEDDAPDGHVQQRVGGRADQIVVRRLRRPRGGGGGVVFSGGERFFRRRVARGSISNRPRRMSKRDEGSSRAVDSLRGGLEGESRGAPRRESTPPCAGTAREVGWAVGVSGGAFEARGEGEERDDHARRACYGKRVMRQNQQRRAS